MAFEVIELFGVSLAWLRPIFNRSRSFRRTCLFTRTYSSINMLAQSFLSPDLSSLFGFFVEEKEGFLSDSALQV